MTCPDEPIWVQLYRSEDEMPKSEPIIYVKKFNEDLIILGHHIVPNGEITVD